MKITITTDADGPQLTLGLSPKEFEDYKTIMQKVYAGGLTKDQNTLLDQLVRTLNRLKFGKV